MPVATALKRRDPAIRITWAVEEWTAPLLTGHPAMLAGAPYDGGRGMDFRGLSVFDLTRRRAHANESAR